MKSIRTDLDRKIIEIHHRYQRITCNTWLLIKQKMIIFNHLSYKYIHHHP